MISSGEKPLTELVRKLVRQELQRKETTGSGGNTLITSEKDLHLVTRGTHKAYYNGVEIGSGSGSITGSGTTNYLPRFTGATAIGNSHLVDDGSTITSSEDIDLLSEKAVKFYDTSSNLNGKIYADLDVEVARHFYIWASATTYIDLKPVTGTLNLYANSDIHLIPGSASAINVHSSKITSLAAGTVAGDAIRFEQLITDHGALTGLGDDDHPQYALLGNDNTFTGDHQTVRGAGGSSANYPTIMLRNTTFVATDFACLFLDDSGYVNVGIDGLSVKLFGGVNSVGNIRPSVTNTYTLGTSSYYWNYGYIKNIYMNDGVLDFRTDNVHKIFYGGTTPNDLVYSTYTKHRFYTTSDTTTDFEICYNGIRCYDNFYLRQGFANDTCYIKNDAAGTMELHVPSGQKLKVVVG